MRGSYASRYPSCGCPDPEFRSRRCASLDLAKSVTSVRTRIAYLAARRRLPSVYGLIDFAEAGGLIFYGSNDADRFRRTAYLVDRILKGVKPADLPIEQPKKFQFIVNLNTAKALGLTIPPSLLLQADQVIE